MDRRYRRAGIGVAIAALVIGLSRTEFAVAHTIDIDAPPERVWAALVDFPRYAEWNTQLAVRGGEARAGAELYLALSTPDASYEFHPVVSSFEEGRRFAWIARTGIPRLFDGEHFFEISPLPSGGTRVTNREEYRGVLSPVMRRLPAMKSAPAGFEKMNLELKRYVEGKRQASAAPGSRPGAP